MIHFLRLPPMFACCRRLNVRRADGISENATLGLSNRYKNMHTGIIWRLLRGHLFLLPGMCGRLLCDGRAACSGSTEGRRHQISVSARRDACCLNGGRLVAQRCSITYLSRPPIKSLSITPVKVGNAMTDSPAAAVTLVIRTNAKPNAGRTTAYLLLPAMQASYILIIKTKRGHKSTEMSKQHNRTTGISADTKMSIGWHRYQPMLQSIGRYPMHVSV